MINTFYGHKIVAIQQRELRDVTLVTVEIPNELMRQVFSPAHAQPVDNPVDNYGAVYGTPEA